jgi:hypothetical protein
VCWVGLSSGTLSGLGVSPKSTLFVFVKLLI